MSIQYTVLRFEPQPSEHEFHPITTRPGFLPFFLSVLMYESFSMLHFVPGMPTDPDGITSRGLEEIIDPADMVCVPRFTCAKTREQDTDQNLPFTDSLNNVSMDEIKHKQMGCGYVSAGRAVASQTRYLWFEPSHWQILFSINSIKSVLKRRKYQSLRK